MTTNKAWSPPDKPDPSEILQEGVADTGEARYETALAKFLWCHEHALKYDPALSAVRLSFALSYWFDLATVFPRALEALCAARDRCQKALEQSQYDFDHFHELAAINRVLGEGSRTSLVFNRLCQTKPEAAKRVYHVAEPFLIQNGEYAACEPFLDPVPRVALASRAYRISLKHEDTRPRARYPVPKFARKVFVEDVATLVALMALNHRLSDAKGAYAQAVVTLDDSDFRTVLDAAMTGHFPATTT